MDVLIKSFIRVHRQIDSADDLCESFPDLETWAVSNPSSISDENRRRILDFPEPAMQSANIAATTSLSKSALLERAAGSPGQLTQAEVDLLKDRYWLNLTHVELAARSTASAALMTVSPEHFVDTTVRLKNMRKPLYEENEEAAFENAENEAWRRIVALAMGPQDDAQAQLSIAKPWVRSLWENIKDDPGKRWGYAVFIEPGCEDMDDYLSQRDAAFFHARSAICCGEALGARWKLQRLDWPTDAEKQGQMFGDRFGMLRHQFKSLVDRAPKRRRVGQGADARSEGLDDNILRNTFLVIDHESIDSVVSSMGIVDDMWVWAVDPDFVDTGLQLSENEHLEFRGYMRVRLQQLVNNFFEQRYFHAEEHQMAQLWEATAKSENHAFVSVKEDEAGTWSGSRSIGSAMRP